MGHWNSRTLESRVYDRDFADEVTLSFKSDRSTLADLIFVPADAVVAEFTETTIDQTCQRQTRRMLSKQPRIRERGSNAGRKAVDD
jgi:hypothetical protein